jgi:hypothetical protein
MHTSQIYILISIIALAAVMAVLIFTRKKMQKPLSKTAAVAFAFVVAGIIFGDNRLAGYSLMGIGVIIAIVDIVKNNPQRLK